MWQILHSPIKSQKTYEGKYFHFLRVISKEFQNWTIIIISKRTESQIVVSIFETEIFTFQETLLHNFCFSRLKLWFDTISHQKFLRNSILNFFARTIRLNEFLCPLRSNSKIFNFFFQVHGKDAVLAYDSDDESIADTTSPQAASNAAASLSNESNTTHNNNNNSSHMPTHQHQHHSSSALAPPPPHPPPSGLISSHFNNGGQYYQHQMTTHDFKPQYLADWYSHGMTSIGGVSRYDPASVASGKHPHHVSAALPTPPSTGHSPIQSLHLLPSTTSAYT